MQISISISPLTVFRRMWHNTTWTHFVIYSTSQLFRRTGGGGGGGTKPITSVLIFTNRYPDSKFHGANLWPIWGRQDPGGPQVDPMNFAIWVVFREHRLTIEYYVFIWHFSCDDASQIWMWFEESSMNFCHIENFTEKLTEISLCDDNND